jgi:hypothetical protein
MRTPFDDALARQLEFAHAREKGEFTALLLEQLLPEPGLPALLRE